MRLGTCTWLVNDGLVALIGTVRVGGAQRPSPLTVMQRKQRLAPAKLPQSRVEHTRYRRVEASRRLIGFRELVHGKRELAQVALGQ